MDDAGAAGDTAQGGQGHNGRYPQKLHVFLLGQYSPRLIGVKARREWQKLFRYLKIAGMGHARRIYALL